MIAQHHRKNHERASDLTNQIKRLINAIHTVADAITTTPEQLVQADTVFALLMIAEEKLAQLEKSQSMEWVGLGGNSDELTEDEIKTARGE